VTFETFPFPEGLTPNIPAADYADDPRAVAIAEAARRLNELRENWLNPPDLVDRVPEIVPGFPDRILPKNPEAAATLKKRTLTNLYNERPAWLDNAHRGSPHAAATPPMAGRSAFPRRTRSRASSPFNLARSR
jgi:type II restriction/modification system DNA methylase subunit YeeA